MPLELVTLRCLKDNYAYLLHSDAGTVLIDAPEAMPVLTELEARGWGLDAILLTHHHDDHVGGLRGVARCAKESGVAVESWMHRTAVEHGPTPAIDHPISLMAYLDLEVSPPRSCTRGRHTPTVISPFGFRRTTSPSWVISSRPPGHHRPTRRPTSGTGQEPSTW